MLWTLDWYIVVGRRSSCCKYQNVWTIKTQNLTKEFQYSKTLSRSIHEWIWTWICSIILWVYRINSFHMHRMSHFLLLFKVMSLWLWWINALCIFHMIGLKWSLFPDVPWFRIHFFYLKERMEKKEANVWQSIRDVRYFPFLTVLTGIRKWNFLFLMCAIDWGPNVVWPSPYANGLMIGFSLGWHSDPYDTGCTFPGICSCLLSGTSLVCPNSVFHKLD